jgi:hypothetical protein
MDLMKAFQLIQGLKRALRSGKLKLSQAISVGKTSLTLFYDEDDDETRAVVYDLLNVLKQLRDD